MIKKPVFKKVDDHFEVTRTISRQTVEKILARKKAVQANIGVGTRTRLDGIITNLEEELAK